MGHDFRQLEECEYTTETVCCSTTHKPFYALALQCHGRTPLPCTFLGIASQCLFLLLQIPGLPLYCPFATYTSPLRLCPGCTLKPSVRLKALYGPVILRNLTISVHFTLANIFTMKLKPFIMGVVRNLHNGLHWTVYNTNIFAVTDWAFFAVVTKPCRTDVTIGVLISP